MGRDALKAARCELNIHAGPLMAERKKAAAI
jgi:hypothetical protein